MCAASGFSGAEYQVLVRQIDDFNITEGVAQCGSMNRLIVSSTGPAGSGTNLANVSIGQKTFHQSAYQVAVACLRGL